RAMVSERRPTISVRAVERRPWGMERLLLLASRPDRAGIDPHRRGPAGVLEPAGLRPGPARLPGLRGLGRAVGDPDGATIPGLVVLVPGPRCGAPPGMARLPGDPGAEYPGAVQPSDGRADLGDRGLDCAASPDRVVRVRPGDFAANALPRGDGGRRAGRVARSVP